VTLLKAFISYSSEDSPSMVKVKSELEKNGIDCYIAVHDLELGKSISEKIKKAIIATKRM